MSCTTTGKSTTLILLSKKMMSLTILQRTKLLKIDLYQYLGLTKAFSTKI